MSSSITLHTVHQNQNPVFTEYQTRIEKFSKSAGISFDSAQTTLKELGVNPDNPDQAITILDSEEFLTFSDLAHSFVDSGIMKKAVLRLSLCHLRGKCLEERNAQKEQDMIYNGAYLPKTEWSNQKLLENYNQENLDISNILGQRSKGRPFIVFKQDGTVDVETSMKMLSIASKQATQNTHNVNGNIVKVYRSGQFPITMIDQCPACGTHPLVDGYCSQTASTWDSVSYQNRILSFLQITKVEKSKLSTSEIKSIAKNAKMLSFSDLKSEYPLAAILYEELESVSKLPTLKIPNIQNNINTIDKGF